MKSLPIVAWAALVPLAAPLSTAAEQLSPEIEEAMESFCALPAKLLPVLSSVTDKATADAAAEPLYRELSGVYEVCDAMRGIRQLTPEQSALVRKRYEMRMRTEWGKLYEQIFRLQRAQCYYSTAFNKQFQTLSMMLEQ